MSTVGDVGYVDDEGYLYLTDRATFMIISGGVNIYPQETEDVLIARRPDVFGDRVRQPEQIVGTAAPQSSTGGLVPPVLHVALDELARGAAQQMLSRQLRPRQGERHHVLKLVAEPVRAAGLEEAGAAPHP